MNTLSLACLVGTGATTHCRGAAQLLCMYALLCKLMIVQIVPSVLC